MDGLAVASMIRRMAKRHGVRVVFLDYLQKMAVDGRAEKRTYAIAENLSKIVAATKGTGVSTVVLAQLNRDAEGSDKRPGLRDLAECGSIERDADVILFLHRDRMVPVGPTEVIIAKARDGECGIAELHYNGNFTRFEDSGGPDMGAQ
jgi:replicative DNA helicase